MDGWMDGRMSLGQRNFLICVLDGMLTVSYASCCWMDSLDQRCVGMMFIGSKEWDTDGVFRMVE